MNLFRQFLDLLPSSPLLVGTVTAVQAGAGTVTVTFDGGGSARVAGSASAGSRVFVQDGRIQGAAPSLPSSVIEV